MAAERRQEELEEDCVRAFTSGNKLMAEQLLPRIPLPAVRAVTTTFQLNADFVVCSMVTLVHLAAYWGWRNVVTALVSVYYCAANSKDSEGQIPLHYAAYNGHLEVVKYFTAQLQCDPMEKDNDGKTPLHYACANGYLNIAQYAGQQRILLQSCCRTMMARASDANGKTLMTIAMFVMFD